MSIAAHLRPPVTALTSLAISTPHPFAAVVKLPRDDQAGQPREATAHGALHWAPHHDNGFHSRMDAIARWIDESRPAAVVTDVSVEVATFVRLLGVPVIVVALSGRRYDAPHLLVHRLADHIVAAWPQELGVPAWLRPYAEKTSYVGGISRFEARPRPSGDGADAVGPTAVSSGLRIVVLGGAGDAFGVALDDCARFCPGTTWTALGGRHGHWIDDPWPQICAADLVVTHAGQSAIADVAAAGRPAVVIPQSRPYDEQAATAAVLRRYRLATVVRDWPDMRAWPGLLAQTLTSDPQWGRWHVNGAAARAATAIEVTAQRCAPAAVQ